MPGAFSWPLKNNIVCGSGFQLAAAHRANKLSRANCGDSAGAALTPADSAIVGGISVVGLGAASGASGVVPRAAAYPCSALFSASCMRLISSFPWERPVQIPSGDQPTWIVSSAPRADRTCLQWQARALLFG